MAKRILIIDDNKDILEFLAIVFQDSDLDVILSETGMNEEEIQLIHPDLVLLDVRINGFNTTGDKICQQLKAHADLKHIPVLLVSAEQNLDSIAAECEADGYFSKPFDVFKFKSAVLDKLI